MKTINAQSDQKNKSYPVVAKRDDQAIRRVAIAWQLSDEILRLFANSGVTGSIDGCPEMVFLRCGRAIHIKKTVDCRNSCPVAPGDFDFQISGE